MTSAPPLKDEHGKYDHRGRWGAGLTGCPCIPCKAAALLFLAFYPSPVAAADAQSSKGTTP